MKSFEVQLSEWMYRAFQAAFPDADLSDLPLGVTATTEEAFGDYQCNAAMGLARLLKRKPRDIAEAAIQAAEPNPIIEKVDMAGPGFINITLNVQALARYLEALQADDRLAVPRTGEGHAVVMDYSSPNVAKPMHIGHIRSTVIGNALDRLYRFLGYRVLADNHLGDWGTQFGLLILGYRHFLDPEAMKQNAVEELERVYIRSYERSQEDEAWRDQARAELVKLQQGDPENEALWKQFGELSLAEFAKIYTRLDVSFDLVRGESFYRDRLAGIVEELNQKGLAMESEGARVVFLDDLKLPPCIVRKKDGGYNYATTDLATIRSRIEEFAPDKIVYVTDERQQLHFRQIFTIAERMGCSTELVHVWFGVMRLPEGTFSTREGNVIRLERLLDEAESRALAIVRETSPAMDPEQQREIARAVGIGAVKYADLSQHPQSVVTFTWEKALALDGNSAPYLQYACARIASVRDKYSERFPGQDPLNAPIRLEHPMERRVAMRLVRFPEAVDRAARQFKPNVLADYLFDLAQTYSTYYQNVPFLKAEDGVRESRVRLCMLTEATLRKGLNLLGIETPERI